MSSIETEDEYIAKSIHKHGWHTISVDASEYTPRFIYTIGLMETYDHPEVIVFGFDSQFAHTLLCNLVDDVKNGKTYGEDGIYEELLEGFPVAIRHVHPTQHIFYFGYALGHIRHIGKIGHLEAVQLLWPDKTSTFPFEAGCDADVCRLQPRLDLEVPPSELKEFYQEYGDSP
jgi:hypothetical protein